MICGSCFNPRLSLPIGIGLALGYDTDDIEDIVDMLCTIAALKDLRIY